MVNKPYEVRGFRLDADFLPVTAAGGGKGDLYCEFEDFMILTAVTMSTSSRQEAMEGEPVRRHVSDAVLNYNKPVYGLFLAIRIDTNTAETFRHGIWYAKGDVSELHKEGADMIYPIAEFITTVSDCIILFWFLIFSLSFKKNPTSLKVIITSLFFGCYATEYYYSKLSFHLGGSIHCFLSHHII